MVTKARLSLVCPYNWSDQFGPTNLDFPEKRPEMTASHHEHIANTLTKEILSGLYRPGDRVPSERDLAARFEVSRGAAREALQRLDQLGVLVVQPGGARVAPVEQASLDIIGHLLDLDDLPPVDLVDEILQVVKGLISLATERAVQRGSAQEIESITALLSRLIQAADAERRRRHAIRVAASADGGVRQPGDSADCPRAFERTRFTHLEGDQH